MLLDVLRIFRDMRGGDYDRERLENRLLERGMMSRFFGRFFRLIDASWKMYYNITVTSLSIVVALAIGTVELLQVLSARLELSDGFWDWLNGLDFEALGYVVVALFLLMWAASVSIWKLRRIEDRWGG